MEKFYHCALCGQPHKAEVMVRLVALPNQMLTDQVMPWCVDQKGNLPGQAYWICTEEKIISSANCLKIFKISAKDLINFLDQHFQKRLYRHLFDLRRMGKYQFGEERLINWWQKQNSETLPETVFLRSRDGGAQKLWSRLAKYKVVPEILPLDQRQLGEIFQREKLSCLLVEHKMLGTQIKRDLQHLSALKVL